MKADKQTELTREEAMTLLKHDQSEKERLNSELETAKKVSPDTAKLTTLEAESKTNKEKISSLAEYSGAVSEVKAIILGGVGVYKETMVKSLTNLDTEIKSRVTSALDETNAKIAEYEADSLKKIDLHIFDILRHVSLGVLGKSVSLQDHEEFILKSLGDAKVHERITL